MTEPENTSERKSTKNEPAYWLDKPENVSLFLKVFYILCGLSFVGGAILTVLHFTHPVDETHSIDKHHPIVDAYPLSYSLYSFLSIVVLIVLAKLLRKVVMRGEDYYE